LLFAVGIACFAVSSDISLSLAALAVAGFGAMTLVASCNTILQTILEDDKRGRVMSFFTVAFMGMAPFGSFGAGTMAGMIGPRDTLLIGSACCLIGTAQFARHLPGLREKVRPIYLKMGILKEVAQGLETAAEQPPLPEDPE
jgi:MFS family permease